jgi:hypothetical protein
MIRRPVAATASQVPDVMPRGGAKDPAKREFDWTPLVILGGLLGTGLRGPPFLFGEAPRLDVPAGSVADLQPAGPAGRPASS